MPEREYLNLLSATVERARELLSELTASVARQESDLDSLQEVVNALDSIVRSGNGSPPLLSRMATNETELQHLKECLDEIEEGGQSSRKVDRQGKWNIKVALIGGGFAILVIVVEYILLSYVF